MQHPWLPMLFTPKAQRFLCEQSELSLGSGEAETGFKPHLNRFARVESGFFQSRKFQYQRGSKPDNRPQYSQPTLGRERRSGYKYPELPVA